MSATNDISVYLISIVFSLYIGLLIIRLMLGFSRADFYNPISQLIVKATNPVLLPMRKLIPSLGRVDMALITLIVLLKVIEVFLISQLAGFQASPIRLILSAVVQTVDFILIVYLYAIIIQAVLSWVAPQNAGQNPAIQLLGQITHPVLTTLRKYIPNFGMLDLTPLVVILIIGVLRRILMHL